MITGHVRPYTLPAIPRRKVLEQAAEETREGDKAESKALWFTPEQMEKLCE